MALRPSSCTVLPFNLSPNLAPCSGFHKLSAFMNTMSTIMDTTNPIRRANKQLPREVLHMILTACVPPQFGLAIYQAEFKDRHSDQSEVRTGVLQFPRLGNLQLVNRYFHNEIWAIIQQNFTRRLECVLSSSMFSNLLKSLWALSMLTVRTRTSYVSNVEYIVLPRMTRITGVTECLLQSYSVLHRKQPYQ